MIGIWTPVINPSLWFPESTQLIHGVFWSGSCMKNPDLINCAWNCQEIPYWGWTICLVSNLSPRHCQSSWFLDKSFSQAKINKKMKIKMSPIIGMLGHKKHFLIWFGPSFWNGFLLFDFVMFWLLNPTLILGLKKYNHRI